MTARRHPAGGPGGRLLLAGVGVVALTTASAARAGDSAAAAAVTVKAAALVEPPVSITANQDLILGAIRLRAVTSEPSGVRASRTASAFVASTGRARAFFVVAGQADQAVSVEIPRAIVLTSSAGENGAVIETTTVAIDDRAGQRRPPVALDRRGMMAFGVVGQVTARQPLSGAYRGLLIATAQYN